MTRRRYQLAIVVGVLVLLVTMPVARTIGFHLLPLRWTGEPARLAQVLELASGTVVADIGAGDGDMAVEVAHIVGSVGVVYATELTESQRAQITRAASSAGVANMRVVAAEERATGLPAECCDAVYMRNVLHHIGDPGAYAHELHKALKPGGRLAIIDFAPATFFHLADTHGVTPEEVIATMTAAGFRAERRVDRWGGRLFLVLFRR